MYCPKCGRQQPSEHNRFCSGCGLELESTAKLLISKNMSMVSDASPGKGLLSPRAKGIWQGIVMFPILFGLFAILIVIYDGLDVGVMDATYSALTLILLLALMRLLYAVFFEEGKRGQRKEVVSSNNLPAEISGNRIQAALPAAASMLAAGFQEQRKRTDEFIQAGSVTEHTKQQLGESR